MHNGNSRWKPLLMGDFMSRSQAVRGGAQPPTLTLQGLLKGFPQRRWVRAIHPGPGKWAVGQPESTADTKAKDTKIPSPGPLLLYGERAKATWISIDKESTSQIECVESLKPWEVMRPHWGHQGVAGDLIQVGQAQCLESATVTHPSLSWTAVTKLEHANRASTGQTLLKLMPP